MTLKKHTIHIEAHDRPFGSRVFLDEIQLIGVTRVEIDMDTTSGRPTSVILTIVPSELVIDGDELRVRLRPAEKER